MKAIKATYEDGHVTLSEVPPATGPVEVLVVFPELADDPWEQILADGSPRPELSKWIAEVKSEIGEGKARPLSVDEL